MPVGVAGGEQAAQLLLAAVVEALPGLGEQPPGPVERVAGAAAVPEHGVLHGAADPVHALVGQPDQVEGVDDQDRVGQHLPVDAAVGGGHVQGAHADPVQPRLRPPGQPPGHRPGVPARRDVDQPVAGHVGEGGGPFLLAVRPGAVEQGLVHPDRPDRPDPVGVVDQQLPVGDHGVVDGVPVAAQLPGHRGHRAAGAADLLGHPPARPVGDGAAGRGDPVVAAGPRPAAAGARAADLAPGQPHRPAERGQVGHQHHRAVLHPPGPAARGALPAPPGQRLDVHHQRPAVRRVVHPEHRHLGQPEEDLADSGRVALHRGPPTCWDLGRNRHWQDPCPIPRNDTTGTNPGPLHPAQFRSTCKPPQRVHRCSPRI